MKCAICLKIKIDNPNLTNEQLFPRGMVEEAETMIKGTAYCRTHIPEDKKKRK